MSSRLETFILAVLPLVPMLINACTTEPRCSAPPPTSVGDSRDFSDHREVDIAFGSGCETLSGTLFMPQRPEPHSGVVFVHGAQPPLRLHYGAGFLEKVVQSGIAVYSYDKRGAGASEGECCPGERGEFDLLARDAAAAAEMLKTRPEMDPGSIGFMGVSQAGWVIPLALEQTKDASYSVVMSGPAVSVGEANYFDDLTDQGIPREEALRRLGEAEREGFNPKPYLEGMDVPSLWLFGALDEDQPTEASVEALGALGRTDVTVRVFQGVAHNLVSHPDLVPTIAEWIGRDR